MATPVSSSSSSVSSASQALDDLNNQLADLQKTRAAQRNLTVAEFRKDTNDVQVDNTLTARDIGTLKDQKTRLNLFSALQTGDAVDVFRFKVDQTAKTKIGLLLADPASDGKIRVQIFARSTGRIVADNGAKDGDERDNFDKLESGALELKRGDYVLRISRQDGVDTRLKTSMSYALQLSQGTFTQDFDTVEKAKKTNAGDPYGFGGVGVGTTNMIDGLTSAYSFINSLPRIGTSGTAKLSGALLDQFS